MVLASLTTTSSILTVVTACCTWPAMELALTLVTMFPNTDLTVFRPDSTPDMIAAVLMPYLVEPPATFSAMNKRANE